MSLFEDLSTWTLRADCRGQCRSLSSRWAGMRRRRQLSKNSYPTPVLVNRYGPGARLTLHQDKNERDFDQPIVSVSLRLPATFLFGGLNRTDTAVRVKLTHGDVANWLRKRRRWTT